ncbi:PucR family transcriptional regulator [Nocardioides sp. Root1257]|uniref:PucR family transcriptional regulator n=1 Tax=unclassified Nocardioides TaxID=2615069 RepID=UPI0006F63ED0|nr:MULTISPECIES: helix-turn-helix domain-containing protein [unclassified Nocardioides]KQW48498.1 PucR family transcriptional regulator [Nocardioides sp. Root1257]KRC47674.1 PucR family transcriptional regulator [Nocardioides sp. Root224]
MTTVPTPRPRAGLGRVLDDLGATLLDLVHGDADRVDDIGGVVIHDPVDAPLLPPQALVLGVGVDGPEQVGALLEVLGPAGAVGLVLRAPVQATPEVRAAADAAGVALLGLSRGVPWAHLAAMLRSLLAEGDVRVADEETLGGLPSGDLFAVANAIASLLDAPITIEDRSSRVLAFSGRQDEADPSRVETVLGRQVPERYARILNERGVFGDLYRTDGPVYIDPVADQGDAFSMPRVAIAVRAGDEVLGSIWAAVPGPLSAERTRALVDAGKLVALHLLRVRAGTDVRRRVRADLVSSVLEGGAGAREALERLGLLDTPIVVLGVTSVDPASSEDASQAHELQRLADAFALHLNAVVPRSAAALLGGVVYGLAATSGTPAESEQRAGQLAAVFLDRIGDRSRPVVAIGGVATSVAEIVAARTSTDRILRVLRERPPGIRVARLADVQTDALLLDLRDLAATRNDRPTGPLDRLMRYDRKHDAHLVDTLRAWLDAFGDVALASERLFVHTNTFRYRLRRVAEVGEIDLRDPRQRFAVMLELAVLGE